MSGTNETVVARSGVSRVAGTPRPGAGPGARTTPARVRRVGLYVVMVVLSVIFLVPMIWLTSTSLKSAGTGLRLSAGLGAESRSDGATTPRR